MASGPEIGDAAASADPIHPMTTHTRSARKPTTLWQHLWQRPDEVMLQYGAGGELLVAKMRAGLSLLVLLLPLISALGGGARRKC